jgi:Tol biopolymer transport system component
LVSGAAGTWTVTADGSARRLGPWTAASWSPRGRYLTVVGRNRLTAVDLRGATQWILARPAVSEPRWYPPTGYRVAYLSASDLRVVAGDGTGDHLVATRVASVAPAWRPGHMYQLAYVGGGERLVVRDADTLRSIWVARLSTAVDRLAWSADGSRLLAFSSSAVRIYTASGTLASNIALPRGVAVVDGALSPDGRALAVIRGGSASDVVVEDLTVSHPAPRPVLTGPGLRQVDWSPDGKWLLVSWPAADQWVFARIAGGPRISAVSRIAEQFSHGGRLGFPQLEGWCCSSQGAAG